ncbi:hypothetical protein [Cellulosimicrobium marinum]|uniref:hypothetical protein n=1 Tax=Cellulosimicrobium marinum TaxID=1638992 RepID=UPI001E2A8590|nr:hypothetical protein [Cellulosimicrobium marinum]MCB7135020.1 hypothetical protein [Cellulosimicrobium marinum]
MRPARTTARLAVASALVLGLAACGSDGGDAPAETETPAVEETTDDATEPAEEETEAAEEDAEAASSDGEQPEWANPVTTPGEEIASYTVGDVRVDVYQVSVVEATKTGNFVDPENNEPIIDVGDEIVYVNYVVTNEGDPVDLGSSLVNTDARYDDWPYMQGMDSITDFELTEAQGVNRDALATGAFRDPSVYTLGTGQSYSYGENFPYQAGSPITFESVITPVDKEGELLHDERLEGSGTGTIS